MVRMLPGLDPHFAWWAIRRVLSECGQKVLRGVAILWPAPGRQRYLLENRSLTMRDALSGTNTEALVSKRTQRLGAAEHTDKCGVYTHWPGLELQLCHWLAVWFLKAGYPILWTISLSIQWAKQNQTPRVFKMLKEVMCLGLWPWMTAAEPLLSNCTPSQGKDWHLQVKLNTRIIATNVDG